FQIQERLEYYGAADLEKIVERSARILDARLDPLGGKELARRSRGTPRIVNRLLRRVRDFAEVESDGRITLALADSALKRLQIDEVGLDQMDRKILLTVIEKF